MTAIHTEGTPLFEGDLATRADSVLPNGALVFHLPANRTPTSQAAALRIRGKAEAQLGIVYACVVAADAKGGCNIRDLEAATGLSRDSLRPRLWHLEGERGRNKPKGERLICKQGERDGCSLYRVYRHQEAA